MKITLLIETPEDGAVHYQRIVQALHEYTQRVAINNEYGDRHPEQDMSLGCTKGPNVFVAKNGVKITESTT